MKSIFNLFAAFVLVTSVSLVSSCKKDDNSVKGNGPVTLHFDNRFGSDDLVLGTTYTNQAGEQLHLRLTGPVHFSITDVLGAQVATGLSSNVIDISALPAGMYMLLLGQHGSGSAMRFTVQR